MSRGLIKTKDWDVNNGGDCSTAIFFLDPINPLRGCKCFFVCVYVNSVYPQWQWENHCSDKLIIQQRLGPSLPLTLCSFHFYFFNKTSASTHARTHKSSHASSRWCHTQKADDTKYAVYTHMLAFKGLSYHAQRISTNAHTRPGANISRQCASQAGRLPVYQTEGLLCCKCQMSRCLCQHASPC